MKNTKSSMFHFFFIICIFVFSISCISCSNAPRTYSVYYFASGVPEDCGFVLYDGFSEQVLTNRAVIMRSKGVIESVRLYYQTNLVLTAYTTVSQEGTFISQTLHMRGLGLDEVTVNKVRDGYTAVRLGCVVPDGFTGSFAFKLYDGTLLIPDWNDPYFKHRLSERKYKSTLEKQDH